MDNNQIQQNRQLLGELEKALQIYSQAFATYASFGGFFQQVAPLTEEQAQSIELALGEEKRRLGSFVRNLFPNLPYDSSKQPEMNVIEGGTPAKET